jgi:hypothetical protein
MSRQWCAVDSCRRYRAEQLPRSQDAVRPTLLCTECLDKLRRNLVRLPGLYRECEEHLDNRRARGVERIRGGMVRGISLNEDIVAARATMLAVASSWAGTVADERAVAARPPRSVSDLSRFLLAHLDWLAGHCAVGDAAVELDQAVTAAEAVSIGRTGDRLKLGPCSEPGCTGLVYATTGAAAGPSGVSCDRGHRWRPNQWLLLAHRLARPRPGTAGDSLDGGDFAA